MYEARSKLGHLLEALSIAQRWQAEDPPNPSTQAVLQHGIERLLTDLKALAPESQQENGQEQAPAAD